MVIKLIMKSPITGKEMKLMSEKRILKYRGKEFEVLVSFYKCEDSGEQFTTNELGGETLKQVYDKYDKQNNI